MKAKTLLTLGLALALATASSLLLGCGGCSSMRTAEDSKDTISVSWEMSAGARRIYAALTLTEALRDDNQKLLQESLHILRGKDMPASMYAETAAYFLTKQSKYALELLTEGLEFYPNDTPLNLLYAEALVLINQADKSATHMRCYLQQHPNDTDAQIEAALLLLKANKFSEAEELFRRIPQKARTAQTELYHAKALLGQQQEKAAAIHLRKALELTPDFVEALAEMAYQHERHQQWAQARTIYEKIRSIRGDSPEILLRILMMTLRLNELDAAWNIIEEGPDTIEFQLAGAALFMEAHQYEGAEKIFATVEKLSDTPHEARLYLAELIWRQRHDAKAALTRLHAIPEDAECAPQAILLRVQILYEQGDKDTALRILRQAQRQHPDMVEFPLTESRILASRQEFSAALKVAEKGSTRWPKNTDMLFLLASLYDELGNKAQALHTMETLLQHNTDHYQALNYVGYTLAEQHRDLPRAQELLRRAVALSPESAYIWDSLAWAQFRDGNIQEAWKSISKAVTLDSNIEPTIWEHYGDIAAALGMHNEARKGYNNALNAKPDNAVILQQKLSKL